MSVHHARQLAFETWSGQDGGGSCLWLGGGSCAETRAAGQHGDFHLPVAKRQTPTSLSQGGALSAPLEPLRGRSRRAVATLRSAHRDRSGLRALKSDLAIRPI